MIKKAILSLAAAAVCAFCFTTGCESSGNKSDSGSGNSKAVGSWKTTAFVEPNGSNNPNTGFFWNFRADGSFDLSGRPGTYTVSGNSINGSGNNPGVGKFDIRFTMNGNTLTGDFIEHWGPNKTIKITAVKQ